MDVKAITLQYLKANGYDGLYNEPGDCACKLDGLFPCSFGGVECCVAGYLQAETSPDFDFCIGPEVDARVTGTVTATIH